MLIHNRVALVFSTTKMLAFFAEQNILGYVNYVNHVRSNISNTRRNVSSDIQTPRSELKNEAEGRVF